MTLANPAATIRWRSRRRRVWWECAGRTRWTGTVDVVAAGGGDGESDVGGGSGSVGRFVLVGGDSVVFGRAGLSGCGLHDPNIFGCGVHVADDCRDSDGQHADGSDGVVVADIGSLLQIVVTGFNRRSWSPGAHIALLEMTLANAGVVYPRRVRRTRVWWECAAERDGWESVDVVAAGCGDGESDVGD